MNSMMDNICIACLTVNAEIALNTVLEAYSKFTSLHLQTECSSDYPNTICSDCHRKIIDLTSFREQCIKSYNQLKSKIYPESDNVINFKNNLLNEEIKFEELMLKAENHIENLESGKTNDICNDILPEECSSALNDVENVDSEDNLFCDTNGSDSTTSEEDATPKTKRARRIKENKSRKLLCPREGCKAAFKTEFYLKGHLRKHDGGNEAFCEICNKEFKTMCGLLCHNLGSHSKEKNYQCDICQKKFSTRNILTVHKQRHAPENKTKICEICGKGFCTSSLLYLHKLLHEDLQLKCPQCPKKFRTKILLSNHVKRHGAVKTFLCLECNNSFYAKNELKRHQLRHQGVRPHKCTLCEAAFYTNTALKRHSRSHTQERPYKCKLCNKDYVNSGSLKEHQRTHTGERPYVCQICNKAFISSTVRKNHYKTHNR